MQKTQQFLATLETTFRKTFPELRVCLLDRSRSESGVADPDWILIGLDPPPAGWESLPASSRILSPLLPEEFEAMHPPDSLPDSISERWFWIPPVTPYTQRASPSVETDTPLYSEDNTGPTHLGLTQLAKAGAAQRLPRDQSPSEDDICQCHGFRLLCRNDQRLALSNRPPPGSPLRYFATGCHYPNLTLLADSNLKTIYRQLRLEQQHYASDVSAVEANPLFDSLSRLLEQIVRSADNHTSASGPGQEAWRQLAFPFLRNALPSAAAIDAHNLRKAMDPPRDPANPHPTPFVNWIAQSDNALSLFSFLTRSGGDLSSNLLANLSLWLYSRPYSRAWKADFNLLESTIPDFHESYIEITASIPEPTLAQIQTPKDQGPFKSRIAAALGERYGERLRDNSDPITKLSFELYASELASKTPHWTSLSDSLALWTSNRSLSDCERYAQNLYERNPEYKGLRLTLVRLLASQLSVDESVRLIEQDIEERKDTPIAIRSLLSWWFEAGRSDEASQLIETIYTLSPSHRGLFSFLAQRCLDPKTWEIYGRTQSSHLASAVQKVNTWLDRDLRLNKGDSLTTLLSIRLALYAGDSERATTLCSDTNQSAPDRSGLAREFWFFGDAETAKALLDGQAYPPATRLASERLTAVLINLSVGSATSAASELEVLFTQHASIALPSAPVLSPNQFLQLHTLELWNNRTEAASAWLERSKSTDPQHEQVAHVYRTNIAPMKPSSPIQNPFSNRLRLS